MQSGIFAVVTIGEHRLYVGEVNHLKSRWRVMLTHFETGKYPHDALQAAWNQSGENRRFTFHKLDDLIHDHQLLRRSQLLKDLEKAGKKLAI
ncbi:hypothetical protein [Vacuolonema iberomarrocanum]|uniref:hypothetical protein n=1 Tax=Vacuolonema iberomarrocanum TaxID=3454632 RepID=UPI003F6E15BF